MDDLLLKINFEMAYDKVKWPFLQQTLRVKGLVRKWCELTSNCIRRVYWNKGVNDYISHYV
jgi:hypothetical protein